MRVKVEFETELQPKDGHRLENLLTQLKDKGWLDEDTVKTFEWKEV